MEEGNGCTGRQANSHGLLAIKASHYTLPSPCGHLGASWHRSKLWGGLGQVDVDILRGLWDVEGKANALGLGLLSWTDAWVELKGLWAWMRSSGSLMRSATRSLSAKWDWEDGQALWACGEEPVRDAGKCLLIYTGVDYRSDECAIWQERQSSFPVSGGVESVRNSIKDHFNSSWCLWHIPKTFSSFCAG